MTRTHGSHPLLAQLEAVLDTYGARTARWPEAVRAELLAFVSRDAQAARLFAEAQALERLLDYAPAALPQGLEARIVASADALSQVAGRGEAMPARRVSLRTGAAPSTRPVIRRMWPELTLLAASLFLGLLIGLSGQALPALQSVALLTGNEDGWSGFAGLLFDGRHEETL